MYLESKIGKPVELVRKRPGLSERFLKTYRNPDLTLVPNVLLDT
jgi:hypothetical protein